MLDELDIRDFALIDYVRVPFTRGLNILTGETGAGKSIIIDAFNAVLGGKVGSGVIRSGAERACIEASFSPAPEVVAWLNRNELNQENFGGLTVSREITKSGSKSRINGTLVNLSLVQELRQKLLTIHAQHEARTLLSSQAQLDMLDGLADETHRKLLARVHTLWAQRRELSEQLKELLMSEEERNRRLDFARFQLGELEDAELLDADEDEKVANQVKTLGNVAVLEASVDAVQRYLTDGDGNGIPGAVDLVQKALFELTNAAQLDRNLASTVEELGACLDTLEERQRWFRRYRDALEVDPETLCGLEGRLAQLAMIKRKYGPTLSDALGRLDDLRSEIERLENSQTAASDLRAEFQQTDLELKRQALELSAKRKIMAARLARSIQDELYGLGMEHCRFEIFLASPELTFQNEETHDESGEVGPLGMDRAEFLIAPNPGQPLLPLSKIASGGELSRVMLAVKSTFARADSVPTVIFDEIDTGLSGRVLHSVRDKLAKLANSHQILCITHQPIIASIADNHVQVSKEQSASRTKVSVATLNEQARLKVLAGMASGQEDQQEALRFAEALFADSRRLRDGSVLTGDGS